MRLFVAAADPHPEWLMILLVFLISSAPAIVCFVVAGLWWKSAKQSRTLYRPAILILLGSVWVFFWFNRLMRAES